MTKKKPDQEESDEDDICGSFQIEDYEAKNNKVAVDFNHGACTSSFEFFDFVKKMKKKLSQHIVCLLYTSDAADE